MYPKLSISLRSGALMALFLALALAGCSGAPATQPAAQQLAGQPTQSSAAQQLAAQPTQSSLAPQAATTSAAAAAKIIEWDYQIDEPQYTEWQKILDACAAETGITIDRQAIPRDKLITKALLAAQQRQMPNILRIDNPNLQEVAATGALAPLTDYGVDLKGLYPNLLDAGSYEGKVYGIAPGINGMAIFYNKDMFDAAGVKVPTNWPELMDAAAKLTKNGVYGMTFSAPATEEGSWQFEPWFWGAGGDLKKLDSPEGVKALQFWADLVSKGYASKSVVQWSQGDVNDQFMAGKAAMQQNGVWNLPALEKSGIHYGVFPIPKPDGGAAPGPMGGEVLTIPVSADSAAMQAAGKVVNCLLSDKKMLEWATLQAYIPARMSVAEEAAKNGPNLQAFVDAAAAERSRPGPPANLGPNYTKISQPLWNAIQAALTGPNSPQDALTAAQQQAENALK
jgi:multiple sugar transport system substrate-binding protein